MAKLAVLEKKYDILDVNAGCKFRINIDVLNEAFGVGRSMFAKAVYPDKRNTYISGVNPDEKYIIWMPKMYGNSSEWKNVISPDGKTIYEVAEEGKNNDWIDTDHIEEKIDRIVFIKPSPNEPYQFVGVFEYGEMNHLRHSYKRIASKIKLLGNPVYKIELLD